MFDWIAESKPYPEKKSELSVIINHAKESNDTRCLGNAYRCLGTLFKNMGQLDSAAYAYITAIKTAESITDTFSLASSYNELGILDLELNRKQEALSYFSKAYDMYALIPKYRGMADAALNKADLIFQLGQPAEAEKVCLQSMADRRRYGDTSEMGYNYELLSRLYLKRNDTARLCLFLRKAIHMFRQKEDYDGLLPALTSQGNFLFNINDMDSAILCYREVRNLALRNGYKKWSGIAADNLAEIYKFRMEWDSAFYYKQLQISYADTLHNEFMLRTSMNMAVWYNTQNMKDEIVDQKVMLGIRLVFIIVLLVFLAALTFSVYMLIRDRNQRKQIFKTEAELKSAEDMLRGQDNERERIARELHDRVGSMLSTVKLHFSTMEEQLKDWMSYQGSTYKKTLELIDETYEEVRRISHDLDSGLLSRFGLRTAMLQLAQIIDATNKLKVTYLDTDVDPEWYKPYQTDLYRITQELLSNTIKHAEAKEVSIQLSRTNGSLIYLYEDDGKGFVTDPAEKPKGIGLVNVRTRVSRMKGVLQLDSSPGHGFNLIIELTIHETGTHSDS